MRIGRSLSEAELESYDHMDRDLIAGVRVVQIPYMPGSYDGITLRNTVFVATPVDGNGNSPLLAHELVHVRQWRDMGVPGYLIAYLRHFLTELVRTRRWYQSYRSIPSEVEARALTRAWKTGRASNRQRKQF